MKDSKMTDEWVARVLKSNPCVLLENGNVRTCPVRLSFPHLFKPGKPVEEGKEPKYGASLIFPPQADISVLLAAAGKLAKETFPDVGTPKGPKLKNPFLKQAEQTYDGYDQEGIFIRATGDRKPPVVAQNLAPITDESLMHPGAWVIATLRTFSYNKGVNKGVSFGLQSVMYICDDTDISGGGSNPASDFAGVKIEGDFNPSDAFGASGHTAGEQAPAAEVDLFS